MNNLADVCIATISWARNNEEETLLRNSLLALSKLQLPVFITDAGSGAEFIDYIKNLQGFTVLQAPAKGVWAQAKNSLLAAEGHGSKFVLYTEPDKLNFFEQHLEKMLSSAELNDNSGIVVASRSQKAYSTFPAFQQMTENTINNCCAEVIGHRFDFTYGPFLLNRDLVSYIHRVQEDIGWGWRPYMFGLAHRLGLTINSFEGDFYCPEDQQQDDAKERLYRMRQLEQNIRGLVLSTTIPVA